MFVPCIVISQKILCSAAQAMAALMSNSILLSKRFCRIPHRFFIMLNAHSSCTLAEENFLLKTISSRSLVPFRVRFHQPRTQRVRIVPNKVRVISLPAIFTEFEGAVRISPCFTLLKIALHRNTLTSRILPGDPQAKSGKILFPLTTACIMKSCCWYRLKKSAALPGGALILTWKPSIAPTMLGSDDSPSNDWIDVVISTRFSGNKCGHPKVHKESLLHLAQLLWRLTFQYWW